VKLKTIMLWLCALTAASVMGSAGVGKILSTEGNVFIFSQLGMEPFGRYLVGLIEITAALLLLHPAYSAMGALLTIGTMCGAIIAHATYLGFNVQGDGGMHIMLLSTVVLSAGIVLVARRKTLPIIGETL